MSKPQNIPRSWPGVYIEKNSCLCIWGVRCYTFNSTPATETIKENFFYIRVNDDNCIMISENFFFSSKYTHYKRAKTLPGSTLLLLKLEIIISP